MKGVYRATCTIQLGSLLRILAEVILLSRKEKCKWLAVICIIANIKSLGRLQYNAGLQSRASLDA
jgi:hypothetical protein